MFQWTQSLLTGGDFFVCSEGTEIDSVFRRNENGSREINCYGELISATVQTMFGIRGRNMIMDWVKTYKAGESLGDICERPRKQLKSLEEEKGLSESAARILKKSLPHGTCVVFQIND